MLKHILCDMAYINCKISKMHQVHDLGKALKLTRLCKKYFKKIKVSQPLACSASSRESEGEEESVSD